MSLIATRTKSVSLSWRGFNLTAQEVASRVGVAASRLGNSGEPVKQGIKTLLVRSYVRFSMDFSDDQNLCDMLPALLTHLGGVDHLCQIRNQVQPEFSEIHFDLPARQSDEIQDGYLSTADIADIFQLNASLSFGFY